MSVVTAAQNRAMELFQSKDPRALHQYLERWRSGVEPGGTEYVLSIIQHYTMLGDHSQMPDRQIGLLTLQYSMQRAYWGGTDVVLTATEFRVVRALTDALGQFITYRSIYDVVHYVGFCAGRDDGGFKTNVRSVIKRIRKKFEKHEPTWNWIENYSTVGYRWQKPEQVTPRPLSVGLEGVVLRS